MSPADLRSRLSEEISDLTPMRTVVPDVLNEGARRHRARRVASVGLAAAAAGLIVLGTALAPRLSDDGPTASSNAPAKQSDNVPQTQTRDEFDAWAAQRFGELLPARFGEVRATTRHSFAAWVDGRKVGFNINVTKTDWENSTVDPSDVDLAPSCSDFGPDCVALPNQNAIAYHDSPASAGMKLYLGGRSTAADGIALNFFGKAADGPVPISNEEILSMTDSEGFEEIWREYTAHPKWVYSSTLMMLEPTDRARSQR